MKYPEDFINKVICGDCLEVMKGMPDKSVDLVLTDPPYGLKGEEPIEITEKALKLAFKKSKLLAVFMDWRNGHRIDSLFEKEKVGELIWENGWISGGRSKARHGVIPTHNTISLFGDKTKFHFIKGTIIKRQPGFSSPRQCSYAKKTGHPYEKPVNLIKYLLENIDCKSVLDPFAGSGTTGVACKKTGRNYILIEKEEKYCKIAKQRLRQEILF